jgi:DNA-binding transcriptional MerR regulator
LTNSVEFITTKNASKLLGVSASSLRVYAQHMEAVGYSFKKVENARQFSKYDLQIISEALDRYKLTGGAIKDALHYVIVKEEKGEAEAEALQSLPKEKQSQEVDRLDVEQFKQDLSQYISENINSTLDKHFQDVTEAITDVSNPKDDTKPMQDEIDRLRVLNEQLQNERDQYKSESSNMSAEIEQLKSMSIWEFRKWKKKD